MRLKGLSVSIPEVEKAVKKHAADNGLKGDINIYLNITEKAAYYTVNGNGGEGQKVLSLKSKVYRYSRRITLLRYFFAFFFPFFFKHIVFVMIARQSRLIKKKGDYFYESK